MRSVLALLLATSAAALPRAERPNVVLILTDDQGWGDFGAHGNPVVATPSLDRLAAESARVASFYVSPVCAPTRAALMTGRWPQRVGVIDTYIGRAMLATQEVTLAEALSSAGYATGIFGKWHLGDCAPMRPQDQGFQRVLVHRGGGIGQPSDPEGGEGKYTDPVLFDEHGQRVEARGYCANVYFDAAIDFARGAHAAGRPFFAYIATNTPHGPFHDVPSEEYARFRQMDLAPTAFPAVEGGHALPKEHDEDLLARIFAMIANVDANVGRLLATLDELEVADDTLVAFLVDNGPNTRRWVGGMRGMKGEVYEGGVRSPLWVRWPARLAPGTTVERIAAHVDVMPTVLEACGVPHPAALDGESLLPLLAGEDSPDWPDRALAVQAHRGDRPVRAHNALLRTQRWKLVSATGFGREVEAVEPRFELYDMAADPLERRDLASAHPDVVATLAARYDAWFDDVAGDFPAGPPRIAIGTEAEPETHLTRQDWRRTSDDGGWNRESRGTWEVDVARPGPYRARVRFPEGLHASEVRLTCGAYERTSACSLDARESLLEHLDLPTGPASLEVSLQAEDGRRVGAYQVLVRPE